MPVGRPPKPTRLKIISGNPGRRPLNDREPQPLAGTPERPGSLTEAGAAHWDRLIPLLGDGMRVLTTADGIALGLLCNDIAENEEVAAQIKKYGYLVKNKSSGAVHLNPLVTVQMALQRRIADGLREFGLTPASRSRVKTVAEARTENPFAEFAG